MNEKLSEEGRTTSLGLLNYSEKYFDAFNTLNDHYRKDIIKLIPAGYYLLCHGIELALKSFIKNRDLNISRDNLKKLGHNLDILLDKCLEKGLDELDVFKEQDKEAIKILNNYYKYKDFEYAYTGYKELPNNLYELHKTFELFLGKIKTDCINTNEKERNI